MVSHIPDAVRHGVEVRDRTMAVEILVDSEGRATGVRYFRTLENGQFIENEQKAKVVVVAGYSIETPRILLNSKSGRFPDGLANSSGLVGKNLMAQAGPVVWGLYEEPIRQYKAPPACACSEEFYETDPRNDFVPRYDHLVGSCRMGFTPSDSVVDRWGRSWDVPNLFIADGSLLPTQGSSNPALTISSLAARTADWLSRAIPRGELRERPLATAEVGK